MSSRCTGSVPVAGDGKTFEPLTGLSIDDSQLAPEELQPEDAAFLCDVVHETMKYAG